MGFEKFRGRVLTRVGPAFLPLCVFVMKSKSFVFPSGVTTGEVFLHVGLVANGDRKAPEVVIAARQGQQVPPADFLPSWHRQLARVGWE